MSRPIGLELFLSGVFLGALLLGDDASAQRTAPAAREAEEHDMAFACERALWKRTADDATAAGLDPSAAPVSVEDSKTRRTRENGVLRVTGTGDYRPSHKVPGFPVRFECAVDLATKTVLSVSYAALDASGAPIGRPPVELVRDAIVLDACRSALDSEVWSDAADRGLKAGGNDSEPDAASVVRTAKGNVVELSGKGRARLSKDYEWQPITFGCRWDTKKEKITKAWYKADDAPRLATLSPDRQALLDGCRVAVRDAVFDDARRRGYEWPRDRVVVKLGRYGDFTTSGRSTEVKGEGWFKSDARHSQSTPISFRCSWDAGRGEVASASFEVLEASRAPSGEIASGKVGTLVCKSTKSVQGSCPAGIRGNVHILRELGSVPCEAYKNWIYSTSGITVWGGCAAEFEFDAR